MKTLVLVNPAAGRGSAARLWPQIESGLKEILDDHEVVFTTQAGSEAAIARDAFGRGCRRFLAVGGDGTCNHMVNGLFENGEPLASDLVVAPIPGGTANELAREMGYHADIPGALRAIGSGRTRAIDLLDAEFTPLDGGSGRWLAYIAMSWGSAAEISYRTSASRYLKKLGGRFSYYAVTLIVTLTYQKQRGDLTIDGETHNDVLQYTGLIMNTEVGGGGMKLAPGAIADDGIADLTLFKDVPRKDILTNPPSWLFEGRHIEHPEIDLIRGRSFEIGGPAEMLVDADGETVGRLPLKVTVRPNLLPVCAPA